MSDLLVAAGMIDAAVDMAMDMADDGFRLPALRRIVRAMLASGDRRAERVVPEHRGKCQLHCSKRGRAVECASAHLPWRTSSRRSRLGQQDSRESWSKLESQGEPDPLLVLSLAGLIRANRRSSIYGAVRPRLSWGTLHDQGTAMVLEQFILRDLADAILEWDSCLKPESR